MVGLHKNLHRSFARLSPVFVALAFAALCGFAALGANPALAADNQPRSVVKREAANAQFSKAEELRSALNGKPADKRTLADYKQVVSSYRRVYLISPRASDVVDALLAVGELYSDMGDRFGQNYYQSAVDSYQFLLREYPGNKYSQDVFLRIGKLQRDQLGDNAQSTKTYEDFLKKYPHSKRKREAEEALAELALLRHTEPNDAVADSSAAAAPSSDISSDSSANQPSVDSTRPATVARVRRITVSANASETRVTIDLADTLQFSSARITHPDRIFFDLHSARLTPELARANIQVMGNLLTGVRVAQNHAGVVRVVLDVNGVKDYTADLLEAPPQLVIHLYSDLRHRNIMRAANPQDEPQPSEHAAPGSANSADVRAVAERNPPVNPDVSPNGSSRNSSPAGKSSRSKRLGASNGKPDLIRPAGMPEPTRDGQSTLTRALGLKIGRIVIDPGHGGHDTGTIGPTGLMEKDLCLDVALRLGKIIQQRLPGAEITYTRTDDTFIPLEERTNIANQAKADLFISIHANSSHDHAARGIETYYLNLKGTPEAMEVAARENASSNDGVHDLEDLVKRITQTEKIDESKDFAEDIQDSLAKRMQRSSRSVKNRGVRKAPFVVLIGADMPSILTEISFLSNPTDEKLLKQPDYRQKVAEGLYQGVADYLQSMNSVTLNLPGHNSPRHPAPSAPVEQSRNQR
ncbi:MAG TPA: N-acetylmuramoyl-L-alanine amidase [Candidatus Acidoferrum sp.]|nr:N-acetylmuramoyl-L-alanine amidase [Candidatus Acidoferrum sp.]